MLSTFMLVLSDGCCDGRNTRCFKRPITL